MSCGSALAIARGAEPVDQRQAPRLVVGVEHLHELLQPFGVHARADLHGDRIGDAAEVFDVRAVDACAVRMPIHGM